MHPSRKEASPHNPHSQCPKLMIVGFGANLKLSAVLCAVWGEVSIGHALLDVTLLCILNGGILLMHLLDSPLCGCWFGLPCQPHQLVSGPSGRFGHLIPRCQNRVGQNSCCILGHGERCEPRSRFYPTQIGNLHCVNQLHSCARESLYLQKCLISRSRSAFLFEPKIRLLQSLRR